MKTIPPNLLSHLAQPVTTLAYICKITRADSTVFAFTTHDENITIDSVEYIANNGFNATTIANKADLSVDNLDVNSFFNSDGITKDDIEAGKFDSAEIVISLVNWEDPQDEALILRSGFLGEIEFDPKGYYRAEVRGLMQKLQQPVGRIYTANCDARLGDDRCKVTRAGFTETGEITAVESNRIFTDSGRSEDDEY
jgi:uncharacterized phage protein (TIGR02218 family)